MTAEKQQLMNIQNKQFLLICLKNKMFKGVMRKQLNLVEFK